MTAPAEAITRQTQDYLAAVEHELADLPTEDRSALLEDLDQHLEALAAEDDDRPVVVRLGPPAQYAADLRSAAGLPPRGSAVRPPTPALRDRLDEFLSSPAGRRITTAAHEVWRLLRELRPAWWVLRGYLLVLVPCLLVTDGVRDFPCRRQWAATSSASSPSSPPSPGRWPWAGGACRARRASWSPPSASCWCSPPPPSRRTSCNSRKRTTPTRPTPRTPRSPPSRTSRVAGTRWSRGTAR
ncbi:HAAS signaling domain-containing protein [Blastococcus brunescens]|uniref:Uncharacterized protein n=1 Tax=Blastococcus brunescens TaxID=1564165 RepID=A0ABZ1AXR5_9ACTN|nr:hypothetical protein [Blastococcus sp. BMG 8361]WRL63356.1 hypothetical protein U6N30_27005 [Blastococcus sp. BMG 8361]